MGELNHQAAGDQKCTWAPGTISDSGPARTHLSSGLCSSQQASFILSLFFFFFRLVFPAFLWSRLLNLYIHSIAVAFEPDWAGTVLGTSKIVVTRKMSALRDSCTCGVEKVAEQTYVQVICKAVLTVVENNNKHKRLGTTEWLQR